MEKSYAGADKRLKYLFENASKVEFTQILDEGEMIGTLNIDGTDTDLYAPEQTEVAVETIATQGTAIAIITIDGQDNIIYSPVTSEVKYNTLLGSRITIEEEGEEGIIVIYDEPTYQVGKLNINGADEYVPTQDTEVVPDKQYYTVEISYNLVIPTPGDSPVLLHWYEYDGDKYVKSTDTVVVEGKDYYEKEMEATPVIPYGDENPQEAGWYELNATVFPVFAPPALGVSYRSNFNSGITVGTITARYITHDSQHEESPTVVDTQTFDIIMPSDGGGSVVSYYQMLHEGTLIGIITIDGISRNIYAPSGVTDVCVDGESVVDENHVAQISSYKDDLDRIYNVCVGMGQTPPSHNFADVMLTAMFAISGGNYRSAESMLNMGMRYFSKEV